MRRKRSRKPSAAKIAAPAGAAGLAATALWRFVQRRRSSGAQALTPEEAPSAMREWTCECGERFRVSGEDRHRVFWREDASDDDPVLGDECPNCEQSLSAQEAAA